MISAGFLLGSLATDLQVQKLLIQLTSVRICWSWSVVRVQWWNKVWTWFAREHATHILYVGPGLAVNELLPSLVLHKRFKRTLFIRTEHDVQIFSVIPFIKLQNDTEQLSWWKMMKNEMGELKTLICFGLSYVQCLEEWVFMSFRVKVSRFYWAFGPWGLESKVTFAHDIPCVQSFNILKIAGHENNMAQPKCLSSPSHFSLHFTV